MAAKRELTHKYLAVKRRLEKLEGKSQLVGQATAMAQVRKLIAKVAPTELHRAGPAAKPAPARSWSPGRSTIKACGPICRSWRSIAVRLPESLIESELFGHRKGSFTGADEHRVGLFEVANGGTLFLDEIGELPKAMQAKLLRFLESGEIRRVGDNDSFIVDVRVICATHRDLEAMVDEGDFREDLMFRINTFEIPLPPLRAADRRYSGTGGPLDEPLPARCPPGERRSVHARRARAPSTASLAGQRARAGQRDRACHDSVRRRAGFGWNICPAFRASPAQRSARSRPSVPLTLREIEMQAIYQSLERLGGNKPKAAEELGISLKTLYNKLNQSNALDKSA